MLPVAHRLTSSESFRVAVRRGERAGSPTVVLHLLRQAADTPASPHADTPHAQPARLGLVVSKVVGGSVTRNQVKRRLRHLMADRLSRLPDSSILVIRAQPAAAQATSRELGADLDRSLTKIIGSPHRTDPRQ